MNMVAKYSFLVIILIYTDHIGHSVAWLIQGSMGNEKIYYGIFDKRLSWFEARETCLQHNYDDLDDGDLSSTHHLGIVQKLTGELSHLNLRTFWTFFHCPNSTTKDWYQTGCNVTDRVGVTCATYEQCATIEYSQDYTMWYHQTDSCIRTLPFICKKHWGLATIAICTLCEIVEWPSAVTKTSSHQESRDDCKKLCEFDCVAYEYLYNLDTCHVFTLGENKTFAVFEVIRWSFTGAVGIKRGMNVTYVPTVEPLTSPVPDTFPCPPEPTTPSTPTTSLAVTTSSPTGTVQTSTATPRTSTFSESTSTSTSTQMPSTTEVPLIVHVIGFINPYADVDVHVFMTPVSWFEAHAICESDEQFGSLYNYNNETMTTRVATILESNGADPNSALWTSLYRQELTETIWYAGGWNGSDCDVVDDVIADHGGQCVYIVFGHSLAGPGMFSGNCTNKLPFACVRTKDIGFVNYFGYGRDSIDAASIFLLYLSAVPISDCTAACKSDASCIGFTFVNGLCYMVNVNEGINFLEYSLMRLGDSYSHYVKAGSKGWFYPTGVELNNELNTPTEVPMCKTTTNVPSSSSSTRSVTTQPASSYSTNPPHASPSPSPSLSMSSSSSSPETLAGTTASDLCHCPTESNVCIIEDTLDHVSLESLLQSLIANLTIDSKSTSSYKRTLISAEDARSSSVVIGTGAIIFLTLCLSVIILPDVIQLALAVRHWVRPDMTLY